MCLYSSNKTPCVVLLASHDTREAFCRCLKAQLSNCLEKTPYFCILRLRRVHLITLEKCRNLNIAPSNDTMVRTDRYDEQRCANRVQP